ncbi:hypothetical protein J4437_05530 [Candidatus Woesearchaeota archaeon]|nr:hypothetical protein [Candidatus Woesearchaeota archaeon]
MNLNVNIERKISEWSIVAKPAFRGITAGIPLVLGAANLIAYDQHMSSYKIGNSVEVLINDNLEMRKYDLSDAVGIMGSMGEKASYYACQDLQEQNKANKP